LVRALGRTARDRAQDDRSGSRSVAIRDGACGHVHRAHGSARFRGSRHLVWIDWHFFDNAEPTIPGVAWLFHIARPLYHAADSPERYSHVYGPLAFISHGWILALLGPGIRVSKSRGIAAGVGSLAILYVLLRRVATWRRALVLTGVCALELLLFRHYSYWIRPARLRSSGPSAEGF